MRSIKINVWENHLWSKVKGLQHEESKIRMNMLTFRYIGMGLIRIFANYSAVITLGLYMTFKSNIDVSQIYSLLISYISIEEPMTQFYNAWISNTKGTVSLKKLS